MDVAGGGESNNARVENGGVATVDLDGLDGFIPTAR